MTRSSGIEVDLIAERGLAWWEKHGDAVIKQADKNGKLTRHNDLHRMKINSRARRLARRAMERGKIPDIPKHEGFIQRFINFVKRYLK